MDMGIFVPKRDEVAGRLHNKELHSLYSLPVIIRMTKSRRIIWAEQVARMGKMNAHRIFVGKPKGRRLLGRPRRKWVNIIKVNFR
jgi:hypothetical protein